MNMVGAELQIEKVLLCTNYLLYKPFVVEVPKVKHILTFLPTFMAKNADDLILFLHLHFLLRVLQQDLILLLLHLHQLPLLQLT